LFGNESVVKPKAKSIYMKQGENALAYPVIASLVPALGVESQRVQCNVALVAQDSLAVERNCFVDAIIVALEVALPSVAGRPEIEPGYVIQEVAISGVHPVQDSGYRAILYEDIAKPVTAMHQVTIFGAVAN
jgi:hypothetical protein